MTKKILGKLRKPRFLLGTRASCPHLIEKCGRDARAPRGFRRLPLIFSLALILTPMVLSGCNPAVQRAIDVDGNRVEVRGNTVTFKGDDGEAVIASDGNLPWPKDKMGDIPELKGNITGVVSTPGGDMVTLDGISKSEYESYVDKLKAQGYEAAYEAVADKNTMVFMGKKGDNGVSVQFHSDGDKGICMIINENP